MASIPNNEQELQACVRKAKRFVRQRALISGATRALPTKALLASALPPTFVAVDWDLSDMTMSLDHVNGMFGLTPQQIEALEESQRLAVQTAIARLVDSAVGKYLTKELIDVVQRRSGVTTATKHAAKYLPVVNGAVGYGTFVVTCDRHILECEQVVRAVWASRRNGAREA